MALSIAAQRKALEKLKYPKAKIDQLLAEKEDVEIDDTVLTPIQVFDEAGFTELSNNLKTGASKDYPEIWCRRMNKDYELGLTGEDAKDEKKVIAALKAKAAKEAGITPAETDKKIKELQELIDPLKLETENWKQKYEDLQGNELYRSLFWNGMNDALDGTEWIARLKRTFAIKKEGDVVGLFNNASGKFVVDDKLNVIPYREAFAAEIKKDTYQSWHKAEAAVAPPEPDPKKTHAPRIPNPALGGKSKKYKTSEEIMAAVDKKFPKNSKEKGNNEKRQSYFNQLAAELV